jgi:hypothetical protein
VQIAVSMIDRWARRRLGAPLGVLAMVSACLLGPAAAGGEEGTAPALSAQVEQCVTATTSSGRSVTFTGQMETVLDARRMAMQIVVEEHIHGESGFHVLGDAGSGSWQRSEVGVKIYRYVRQVTNLPAPAAFRALVRYRWTDEAGHVIRTDERHTAICREPGARANPTGASPGTTSTPGGADPTTGAEGATPPAGSTSAAMIRRA